MSTDLDSLVSSASSKEEEVEEYHVAEVDQESEMEYPISSPLLGVATSRRGRPVSFLAMVASLIRKSLGVCSVEPQQPDGMVDAFSSAIDVGPPTDVRHLSHVTYDRFHGFVGRLPEELQPEVSRKAPSASTSVFGVSPNSMQCMYDHRGNSVPMILLLMQQHLYAQGGLRTEGIFRINGENGLDLYVREQLNKGIVPLGVDLHCLANLIKAWFRELPSGVLDSLNPDQVMHCNTEEECSRLANILPPTEAALLDWAINLMADVVEHECHNKMNVRSISMVFAPNMAQMADPLTALVYAVQVMNFLGILILKAQRERHKSGAETCMTESENSSFEDQLEEKASNRSFGSFNIGLPWLGNFRLPHKQMSPQVLGRESGDESFNSSVKASEVDEKHNYLTAHSANYSTIVPANKYSNGDQCLGDRFSLTRRVKKLCWHPIFHPSRTVKKPGMSKTKEEMGSWT